MQVFEDVALAMIFEIPSSCNPRVIDLCEARFFCGITYLLCNTNPADRLSHTFTLT